MPLTFWKVSELSKRPGLGNLNYIVMYYLTTMQQIPRAGILAATRLLDGTSFENARIFVHHSDEKDVVGFVLNKPFNRNLNELTEFSHSKPIALFNGGPVDHEHLFVLHCRPDLIPDSEHINGNVYFGGNFKTAVALLNDGSLPEKDIRIFIGYCGWDKDQLDEELREGSWIQEGNDNEELFKVR